MGKKEKTMKPMKKKKYVTVYPTDKLRESGALISISMGVSVQPNQEGPIELIMKNAAAERNLEHYIETGKLSLEDPNVKEPTKKELILKAEELGIEWTKTEKKMSNEKMTEIISEKEAELAEVEQPE